MPGVRELHQGPAGRNAGDGDQLSASGARRPARLRSRAARLWDVYAEQGDHARALAAVESVTADSSWFAAPRFLAGLSQLNLKRYDEAFATFRAAGWGGTPATSPSRPRSTTWAWCTTISASYSCGGLDAADRPADVLLQQGRGSRSGRVRTTASTWATPTGKSATPQAAIYWLREAVRRNPADGEAHFVLGAALARSGNAPKPPASASWRSGCRRRTRSGIKRRGGRAGAQGPRARQAATSNCRTPDGSERALASSEQRDQQELARFYLDRGRRLFQQENDREAIVELESRAVSVAVSGRGAPAARPSASAQRPGARGDRRVEDRVVERRNGRGAHRAGRGVPAGARSDAARAEAERALVLDPSSAEAERCSSRRGLAGDGSTARAERAKITAIVATHRFRTTASTKSN